MSHYDDFYEEQARQSRQQVRVNIPPITKEQHLERKIEVLEAAIKDLTYKVNILWSNK